MYDLATCDGLSEDHGCTNIDKTFDHILMFDAHNAYNNRADGYGDNDTCNWPPPYEPTCVNVANHEFTMTDLLNMGVRAFELDNWWCYGAMRLAHLLTDDAVGCMDYHRLYADGIREFADWLEIPENKGELIRIYMNEKQDQGHDSEINDPIALFLGDKVITPKEYNETYNYQWPTMKEMRKHGKNVVIATASTAGTGEFYTHGDHYIHRIFWEDIKVKEFTDYPDCGGKTKENHLRFYSDSTKYGRAYDGTKQTGTILDFIEYVKCNIQYPGADQINPDIMKTGVFTWAEGEPKDELTAESCVILDGTEKRWYVASSCTEEQFFACQSTEDSHDWVLSTSAGSFNVQETYCPDGYKFSIPHDGFEQQKLLEAANGVTLWLDYTPWLPGYTPPSTGSPIEPTTEAASSIAASSAIIILSIIIGILNVI
ncbi:uncharacterized protein [Amphiura filiformis]|uniref:uncharacterized protein n=1 Tax=Amphiura filiformis TaxID=82378 RepID=UPI003B215E66